MGGGATTSGAYLHHESDILSLSIEPPGQSLFVVNNRVIHHHSNSNRTQRLPLLHH